MREGQLETTGEGAVPFGLCVLIIAFLVGKGAEANPTLKQPVGVFEKTWICVLLAQIVCDRGPVTILTAFSIAIDDGNVLEMGTQLGF